MCPVTRTHESGRRSAVGRADQICWLTNGVRATFRQSVILSAAHRSEIEIKAPPAVVHHMTFNSFPFGKRRGMAPVNLRQNR
jgi:hypothetical protein